jgi:hypothetical protein
MKYFSKDNQYVNVECQNCGRVLKIPHRKCITVLGGLSVTPAVICQCGTVSSFIEDKSSDYQKNTGRTRIKNDHHMPELIDIIERFLPLNKWNFKTSAQYICYSDKWNSVLIAQDYYGSGDPFVLYDSEKCRIRLHCSWSSREYERSIEITYGRLGVPDDTDTLLRYTDQRNYHLYWHSVYLPLYFLDGLSPQEAKNAKHPLFIDEFEQSDMAKSIKHYLDRDLALDASIWETYGQRLFDIFDIRNKDLWEQYSAFVSEYWKTLQQV